jgi:hypothetical protein
MYFSIPDRSHRHGFVSSSNEEKRQGTGGDVNGETMVTVGEQR